MPSLPTHFMDRKRFDEVRKADHICRETLLLFLWTTCCFYDPTALTSSKERRATFPSSKQRNLPICVPLQQSVRWSHVSALSLEERIKQHISKSIANPPTPHIRQRLPRPCKATSPHSFTNPPSLNTLTMAYAPCITIKTSFLFSLELALHFISPP